MLTNRNARVALISRCLAEPFEPRRLLANVPAGFIDEGYGGVIQTGTAFEFAPDGRAFIATQDGDVRVITAAGTLLAAPAINLDVDDDGERGLLGIALDPAFASNRFIYLYYTIPAIDQTPPMNNISRFVIDNATNTIDPASRAEIWRFGGLAANIHQGGAIHFGPDGMLYAAHGEVGHGPNAQLLDNMFGKILRFNVAAYDPQNPAAVIPSDNPSSFNGVTGTTVGNYRVIWAVGLRNPFTFAFHPTNGMMTINDVGAGSWEEVNIGLAGHNYGWPATEGQFNPAAFPDFDNPLYSYGHVGGNQGGFAIAGGAFYVSNAATTFPPQFHGKYFFGEFSSGWIGYLDPNAPPAQPTTAPNFATATPHIVDLRVGSDGALYYLQRAVAPGVRRIRADPPRVLQTSFNFLVTPQSLSYRFSANVEASINAADLTLLDLTTSQIMVPSNIAVSYNGASNTATFTFPGFAGGILPDGNYRATIAGVTDTIGNPLIAPPPHEFFVLGGDANRDRAVDLADFSILTTNFNMSPRDFSEGDFNYDGVVNLFDFGVLTANYNRTLAAPGAVPRHLMELFEVNPAES